MGGSRPGSLVPRPLLLRGGGDGLHSRGAAGAPASRLPVSRTGFFLLVAKTCAAAEHAQSSYPLARPLALPGRDPSLRILYTTGGEGAAQARRRGPAPEEAKAGRGGGARRRGWGGAGGGARGGGAVGGSAESNCCEASVLVAGEISFGLGRKVNDLN